MLATFFLLIAAATAQTILPSAADTTFPACALQCQTLLAAQTACVPPQQAATDQYIYDQCFCQQPTIESLLNTPDGVCDAECPAESDRQLLETWYQSFCQQVAETLVPTEGGVASTTSDSSLVGATTSSVVDGTTITSTLITPSVSVPTTLETSGTTPSVVVVTITSTNTPSAATPSTQPANGAGSNSSASSGSWIDTHWKWILMVAVLIVGLGLIAFLAVYFKRRQRRKVESQRAAASGFPPVRESRGNRASTATLEDMFGPHQHQHMTRGWDYSTEQRKELGLAGAVGSAIRKKSRERKQSRDRRRERGEKGKGRETAQAPEFDAADRPKSSQRREPSRELRKNHSREQSRRGKKERDPDAIEKG